MSALFIRHARALNLLKEGAMIKSEIPSVGESGIYFRKKNGKWQACDKFGKVLNERNYAYDSIMLPVREVQPDYNLTDVPLEALQAEIKKREAAAWGW